jgi:mono/diheme cytochrome c family protein
VCITCHSAPGIQKSEIGKGLSPTAPSLIKVNNYFSPQQVYWIVKHGIDITGMPSFGITHTLLHL